MPLDSDVCRQGKVSTTGDGSQVARKVDSVVVGVVAVEVVVVVAVRPSQDPQSESLMTTVVEIEGIFPSTNLTLRVSRVLWRRTRRQVRVD